ncbi:MAG TPA: hypothetical protein VNO32_43305 [Candidatus Acidoferrum sp.]|nr:hypothetical protein [Candidatus Acidoferrum sp.]
MPSLVARNLPPDITAEEFADFLWTTMSLAIAPASCNLRRQVVTGEWSCRFKLTWVELVPFLNTYLAQVPFQGRTLKCEPAFTGNQITIELPDGKEELNRHGLPILK